MLLRDWQKTVDKWINEYGVRYFDVMTNTLLLNEEIGEFSRIIARSYGEQSFKKEISADDIRERIKEEMSDIFFVLTCLANQMDIDLTKELEKNISKKTKRDIERHRDNPKLNKS